MPSTERSRSEAGSALRVGDYLRPRLLYLDVRPLNSAMGVSLGIIQLTANHICLPTTSISLEVVNNLRAISSWLKGRHHGNLFLHVHFEREYGKWA